MCKDKGELDILRQKPVEHICQISPIRIDKMYSNWKEKTLMNKKERSEDIKFFFSKSGWRYDSVVIFAECAGGPEFNPHFHEKKKINETENQ